MSLVVFSSRVPPNLDSNALSRALHAARAASRSLIDLTLANPTKAGFEYPTGLIDALQSKAVLTYDPAPFGLWSARQAVAGDYARRGISVPSESVVLTSSTSEAYSVLFKLLCDASRDQVLTPSPSYPLFEHLTRLDGVVPASYTLDYHGRWMLEPGSLDAAWSPRTRAVLAVSPNNPTGSVLSGPEIDELTARCSDRDAALILDEVFADYPLADGENGASVFSCLTFRLGGLSKSAGLPQMKLAWIAVDGPEALRAAALERLEFICDAYLSVSTPVQAAAATFIEQGAVVRRQIAARVRANYDLLQTQAAAHPPVEVLPAEAGWSAVIRVPARRSEEELVLELLERDAVVVHPGFFFDFPREAFLVVSLLPPGPVFEEGVVRILNRVAG